MIKFEISNASKEENFSFSIFRNNFINMSYFLLDYRDPYLCKLIRRKYIHNKYLLRYRTIGILKFYLSKTALLISSICIELVDLVGTEGGVVDCQVIESRVESKSRSVTINQRAADLEDNVIVNVGNAVCSSRI